MTQQDKTWTLKRICLPEDENRLTDTKVDVGDLVKLIFMQLPTSMGFDGESMWVIVDHID